MDGQREGSASINLLELSRPAVKPIELLYHVCCYLLWWLLAVDLSEVDLGGVECVDAFDHLAGVFLEKEDEEFVLTGVDYVDQSLSLLAVQLAWKDYVGDRVYH